MRLQRSFACVALLLLTACGEPVCTMDVVMIQITALTAAGDPVTGLTIRDTVLRTGHGFQLAQMEGIKPGGYIIFGDGYGRELGRRKDFVKVTGHNATQGFTALYEFEAGECHVGKLAGPDTVVVTPWYAPD